MQESSYSLGLTENSILLYLSLTELIVTLSLNILNEVVSRSNDIECFQPELIELWAQILIIIFAFAGSNQDRTIQIRSRNIQAILIREKIYKSKL